jgi:hypothetical protein
MGTPTITTLTSSLAPSFFEDEITFNINVAGTPGPPTGNVVLSDSVGPTVLATLPLDGSGDAQFIINALNPGLHTITATYQGDGTYDPSHHDLIQQIVDVNEPTAIVGGFAIIASFSATGDTNLVPQAELNAIPASAPAHTSLTLLWTVLNVPKIQITALGGFDTGVISTTGNGAYVIGNGISITTTFTLDALDAAGAPIIVGGSPLSTSATATVV